MSVGYYLIVIVLMALVGVLLAGVALMAIGGKANAKHSNNLMMARVSLQGLVLMLIMFVLASGNH